jgi:GTP-binding protein EngB required for normal cell division
LESLSIPTIPVLTKADKLSNNELAKNVRQYSKLTNLPVDAFTIFSSEDGRGVPDLWSRITAALQEAKPEAKQADEEEDSDSED